ncbi:hypothetical protein N9574_01645 [bacterium]|nr:hypothetical protein [bacterium]
MLQRRVRHFWILIVWLLVATSCRVATADIDMPVADLADASEIVAEGTGLVLPAIGPIPGRSHWHAAYVVRVCDDVLPPFDSAEDPLGIHSHSDGIMHVHPFFEASGFESATLGLFADAMGFTLSDGELTLPGGGTWRDGDLCDGVPGRVFVDRWQSSDPESRVERIFDDLESLRFEADGELYQIAFAPVDSFPVVPPATARLPELSNLGPPPEPWVDMPLTTGEQTVSIWQVSGVDAEPCSGSAVPERVLFGAVRCFEPIGERFAHIDVMQSARAVSLNRQPAVELQMTAELRSLIGGHFAVTENPLVLAIEVDGFVVTAPRLSRLPVSERLVVSGGLTVEAAERLAALLNQ